MDHDAEPKVLSLLARFAGVESIALRGDTTLFGDLGIDGDDAAELMSEFERRFLVDMTAYDPSQFFGGEGMWPWFPVAWLELLFRRGTPENRAGLKLLTVQDLIDAASNRRWPASA